MGLRQKYIVITDGGDGDFSWYDTYEKEEAEAALEGEESYYGILVVDFEDQSIKRIPPYCQ